MLRRYRYEYDALNRLQLAAYNLGDNSQPNRYSESGITYDRNGNILTLQRMGHTNSGATTFDTMDNLIYTYDDGNKLSKVADSANDTYGFVDGTDVATEYSYDANGNMTSDANKGITSIVYNHLNMPTKITVTGSNAGVLDYVYDATGVKLRKSNSNGTITDYIGNYVYEGGSLKQITHPEGYIEPDGQGGYDYVYRYVDIWGNTRVTYADDNNDGSVDASEIRREQNYYPFGLEHKGYNNISYGVKNDLKTYQGQEFTEDLGLDTHEWKYRISDPSIGRFWQIDPLADEYVYNSTYAFQENKMGMGIELEGAELLGLDVAQKLIQRGISFFEGADKMVTGGSNLLNNTVNGEMVQSKISEGNQTVDTQEPIIDPNFEMVLDGASQVNEALPNKQDVRDLADGTEFAGDIIKVGGLASTPATGPGGVAAAGVGDQISNIGLGLNLTVDLIEGDLDKVSQRIGIEVISFGFGSFVRQSGAGDEVMEQATEFIANKGSKKIIESVPKKEDKEK